MKFPPTIKVQLLRYRQMGLENELARAAGKRTTPHSTYSKWFAASDITHALLHQLPDAEKFKQERDALLAAARKEAEAKKKPEKVLTPRDLEVKKFLADFCRGSTMHLEIVEYGERLVWARWPGQNEWSGRGSQSYRPTWHYLLDMEKPVRAKGFTTEQASEDSYLDGRLPMEKRTTWTRRIRKTPATPVTSTPTRKKK